MTYVRAAARHPVRTPLGGFESAADGEMPAGGTKAELQVIGQGAVSFVLQKRGTFRVTALAPDGGAGGFQWTVEEGQASVASRESGEWTVLKSFPGAGLDADDTCSYWFSFDSRNRALIYGIGELRLGTSLGRLDLPDVPKEGDDPYAWLGRLRTVEIEPAVKGADAFVWRDPIVSEPPMRVLPHDTLTMADIAKGKVTAPGALNPICQLLYDNVAGASFELDTPDFPDFAAAITASIENEDGWCHQRLKEKASFFDKDKPQPFMTYLRITLGRDQGESPGIPYVLEIWPGGHYSPIHNHAEANAVIRVLHGRIHVTLYPMLSATAKPFGREVFGKGDVTWISPWLNQVHELRNRGKEPCITIQCYMYEPDNLTHAPEFNDLINDSITGFAPYTDGDFLWFKEKMREEWEWR